MTGSYAFDCALGSWQDVGADEEECLCFADVLQYMSVDSVYLGFCCRVFRHHGQACVGH